MASTSTSGASASISFHHPDILAFQRTLTGSLKLRAGLPCAKPPSEYCECNTGDVFWDVTAPYILYVRQHDAWLPWNPGASFGAQLLAEHPSLQDRYLWIGTTGPAWRFRATLHNQSPRVDTKQYHVLDEVRQVELEAILGAGTSGSSSLSLDLLSNRARYEAEARRRRENGVVVHELRTLVKRKRLSQDTTSVSAKKPRSSIVSNGVPALDEELDHLRRDNSRLEKSLQNAEKQRDELKLEYDRAQGTADELRASNSDLQTRLADTERALVRLKAWKADVTGIVDAMDIPGLRGKPE
ncbi:hypothetical protein FB45DRAFT_889745 [Roridomyces roridus]|uniref:Uncharacterized protein n=1 Tax=Roridomyces roridus TaxID=1738132 RepID=A0AAD7CL88_9AGAR|nr:hypothetical protein FB45DRAFT_889745 [Roridomyces roridus]